MRTFYAWLLIAVSNIQWVGGHLCYQVDYLIEVNNRAATAVEAEIASRIYAETGLEIQVTQLDKHQTTQMNGLGYASPFIFLEETDSGAVYYTIDDKATDSSVEVIAKNETDDPNQDGDTPKTALFKRLFNDFLMPAPSPVPDMEDTFPNANFQLAYSPSNFYLVIPTPPPDLV